MFYFFSTFFRCGLTLFSLLSKAKHPERLRIGILQQNADGDLDCEEELCKLVAFVNNATPQMARYCAGVTDHVITTERVEASQSRGPVTARARVNLLRPREADSGFCLQIDSHMLVAQDWDVGLMDQWGKSKNEKAVLSTYVPDLKELTQVNGRREVPVICRLTFHEGVPRNVPATNAMHLSKPKLSTLWAAGFSFAKCHADAVVPYDPHLPQIFDGEEFSRAARLWTHGYDFYAPSVSYVFHNYTGSSLDLGWQTPGPASVHELATSRKRLWTLLGMPGGDPAASRTSLGPFGLGSARTLRQFESFVGVNLAARVTLDPERGKCGDLRWVKPRVAGFAEELSEAYGAPQDRAAELTTGHGDNDDDCGSLLPPVPDVSGQGGFTARCHNLGKRSFKDCEAAVQAKKCGAMTYTKDGTCSLHDTERGGFQTDSVSGALLVVRTPSTCKKVNSKRHEVQPPPAKTYYRSTNVVEGVLPEPHNLAPSVIPGSSGSSRRPLLLFVAVSALVGAARFWWKHQVLLLRFFHRHGLVGTRYAALGHRESIRRTDADPAAGFGSSATTKFDYDAWAKNL